MSRRHKRKYEILLTGGTRVSVGADFAAVNDHGDLALIETVRIFFFVTKDVPFQFFAAGQWKACVEVNP